MRQRYPSQPIRPLKAVKAFFDLVDDRDDTRYVFAFFNAVNGRSNEAYYERFLTSDYGKGFLADPEALGRTLTDRATLESHGPGTFAAVYLEYLDAENLHPLGVHEAAVANAPEMMAKVKAEWPDLYWLLYHGALTHDLYHVLTGYSRDPMGEALLLVFTGLQTGSRGARLLGALAGLRIRYEIPAWPVGQMMKESVALARHAEHFPTADLASFLPLPLEEARQRVNITAPQLYLATREAWRGPEPVTVKTTTA
jgi:ubiquinone biosynthesis protein COQ4